MHWASLTQKRVTLSRAVAEYVVLADVIKEVLFMQKAWRFMYPEVGTPCIPVQLAQSPLINANSKHVDVHHHVVK